VCSALTVKALEDKIVVLDELSMSEPKTREMSLLLDRISVDSSALVLMTGADPIVEQSTNNLPDVKLLRAHYVNVRDLLKYDYLVIPQAALTILEEIFG
jgi:large subunit ribosomal protein L4